MFCSPKDRKLKIFFHSLINTRISTWICGKMTLTFVKRNIDHYFQIEEFGFETVFNVMKNFVETIEDTTVHLQAEAGAKPFRNFKYVMDNSGPYRNKLFAFKEEALMISVERQI